MTTFEEYVKAYEEKKFYNPFTQQWEKAEPSPSGTGIIPTKQTTEPPKVKKTVSWGSGIIISKPPEKPKGIVQTIGEAVQTTKTTEPVETELVEAKKKGKSIEFTLKSQTKTQKLTKEIHEKTPLGEKVALYFGLGATAGFASYVFPPFGFALAGMGAWQTGSAIGESIKKKSPEPLIEYGKSYLEPESLAFMGGSLVGGLGGMKLVKPTTTFGGTETVWSEEMKTPSGVKGISKSIGEYKLKTKIPFKGTVVTTSTQASKTIELPKGFSHRIKIGKISASAKYISKSAGEFTTTFERPSLFGFKQIKSLKSGKFSVESVISEELGSKKFPTYLTEYGGKIKLKKEKPVKGFGIFEKTFEYKTLTQKKEVFIGKTKGGKSVGKGGVEISSWLPSAKRGYSISYGSPIAGQTLSKEVIPPAAIPSSLDVLKSIHEKAVLEILPKPKVVPPVQLPKTAGNIEKISVKLGISTKIGFKPKKKSKLFQLPKKEEKIAPKKPVTTVFWSPPKTKPKLSIPVIPKMEIPTTTKLKTPTITKIKPPSPTLKPPPIAPATPKVIPPFLPVPRVNFGGIIKGVTPKKTKLSRRKYKYTPSIVGIVGEIKVPRMPKKLTGLEIRPLIGKKRKRRKKRGRRRKK